jgi:glycosyltransferase involved in cell wall biosynthesis
MRTVSVGTTAIAPALRPRVDRLTAPRAISANRPDVVVASSLAALSSSWNALRGSTRLICHVHELDGVAERVLPEACRQDALAAVTRFVAAGPAVQAMLVERWGIEAGRVATIDEFIDPPPPGDPDPRPVRRAAGAGDGDALVVAVGAIGPRKGVDYFVDTVAALRDQVPRIHGAWVGGGPDHPSWGETEHDIAQAGLGGRVRLIPTVSDARPFLAAADVVLTTAREDPYPLVVLEAGAAGTAVAGFTSGGVGSMMADAGLDDSLADVGDVIGLADVVSSMCASRPERERRANVLGEWVRSTHLTHHLAPRLWETIVEVA